MKHTHLTDTEEYIWNYINQHFQLVSQMTISEFSEAANVSNASIIRTLKKKGYNGFSEFKHALESKNKDNLYILEQASLTSEIKQSIIKNYQEVIRTLNTIDVVALETAISLMQQAQRIIIFARGFSEMIAQELLIKCQLTNKYCEMHTDPNIIRPVSERLSQKDFVIFISLNGETTALVEAAANCQQKEISSLLISASPNSSLAQLCPVQLIGFKTDLSYFPDFEVHSRLPLSILSRILLDAYAAGLNEQK